MKKILSVFSVLLLAGSLWAADVTVTESFSKVANFTVVSSATTLDGDLTAWNIRYGRKNGDVVGGTSETGVWLQGQSKYGYLEMNTALEGGIKQIAFNWGHGNEKDYTVVLRMFLRGTNGWESTPDTVFTHVATAKTAYVDSVVYDLQCKKNMRIKFDNRSVKTSDGSQPAESKGRPVIGKITITPYLIYGTKEMTVSLLNGSFTNNTLIDQTDEADPVFTYSSNATSVATVNANTGEVTPVATGDATITAKWGDVKVTYVVHVVDGKLVENFSAVGTVTKAVATETEWEGDVCAWNVKGVRRAWNDTICINPRKQGMWSSNGAYMETVDTIEGGIKHVTFNWKQWGSESGQTLKTTVTAGTKAESQEVAGVSEAATGNTFDKEMEVKDGVKLRIDNASYKSGGSIASGKGRYVIENIQITPYLLYTMKSATAKITAGTYTNEALINNTEATPTYKSSNETVATVASDGKVTLLSVGTTTITAKWEEVYTSYELEVLDNVTMVTFDANGGDGTFTEPISYGAALQEIELPTKADCAFNAYFLTNDGKNRFTVTNGYGVTKFLANLAVESVQYTDANRNWIYQGDNLTLYAQWKKKRTITLYNQEATAAGTQAVKIAYCQNNEFEKLDSIECPTKAGNIFLGYFTEENGEGQQLIDKDGKFLANVEGFTNEKSQWILNKDTFLYANWKTKKCTITLKCNYTDGPADVVFEATYGQESPLTSADVHTRENYTMYRGYWMDPETEASGTRLVNPTGKFTTGVGGYTDANQKWIRDAEDDITLYAHWTLSTLVLNEEADNADLLNQYDGKTMDVKLTRSNLVANVWNSLCLPFAIAKTDLGTAQVVEMTGAEMEGDVINVTFAEFNSDSLVAGMPYLVKPTDEVALTAFEDKKIDATPKTIGDNGLIQLVGIYSPFALTANDKSKLFLAQPDGQGNNLFFANQDGSLKGMRAYFNIVNAGAQASARVGRMVINQTNTPTGNENVNVNANATQKVIINGQLMIIREGKQYNAMGVKF